MKSMTGYGKSQISENDLNVSVEIKAVNHRNRDLRMRLPYILNPFEMDFRRIIEQKISRGSIDVSINYEDLNKEPDLKLDINTAQNYLKLYQEIEELCDEKINSKALLLAKTNAVFNHQENDLDEKRIMPVFSKAIEQALNEFDAARIKEGEHLKNDLAERIKYMQNILAQIKNHAVEVVNYQRQRLLERLESILDDNLEEYYNGQRVAAEMVIFADKSDVTEETTRLESHLEQFLNSLKTTTPIGKNLDFLVQEILRETNTIGSKANYLEITKLVVEMKTNIEKVREQEIGRAHV